MANRITPDSTAPSIRFFALRADAPATIVSSEPGLAVSWRRSLEGIPLAGSATVLSVSNLSTIDQSHTSGGMLIVDAATGEHRLDLHSDASAVGADGIDLIMSATDTDLVFVVPPITLQEPALAAGAEMDLVDAPNNTAVDAIQNGLGTSAKQDTLTDETRFLMAVLMGAISNAQNAAEEYVIERSGSTFTVTFAGLDEDGNRTSAALVKS